MSEENTCNKENNIPITKTCTKCGEAKQFDLFSKGKRYQHGRRPTCKSCDAAYVASRKSIRDKKQIESEERKMTYPRIPDDMKVCRCCLTVILKSKFSICRAIHDGYSNKCKECTRKNRPSRVGCKKSSIWWGKYYSSNSKRINEKNKGCLLRSEKAKMRYEKNREDILEKNRSYRMLPSSKASHCERQKRREQRKRNATPSWLSDHDLKKVSYLYWLAQDLNLVSDQEYHVDHIVPLQGKNVCGLHVPWNLQILPASLNLRKSNRHEER